ncbi:hypothetical protein F2P81_004157 [Scophthalmus maximus]|uniref:Uncharacterized protein n=1 Tax=Scophthalmus maximus TaxID=52904 RepID=A0A6A4TGC8_SCOMX|nr:hypothetical protein F2P81_004157 [Scophthalmus maximus]
MMDMSRSPVFACRDYSDPAATLVESQRILGSVRAARPLPAEFFLAARPAVARVMRLSPPSSSTSTATLVESQRILGSVRAARPLPAEFFLAARPAVARVMRLSPPSSSTSTSLSTSACKFNGLQRREHFPAISIGAGLHKGKRVAYNLPPPRKGFMAVEPTAKNINVFIPLM